MPQSGALAKRRLACRVFFRAIFFLRVPRLVFFRAPFLEYLVFFAFFTFLLVLTTFVAFLACFALGFLGTVRLTILLAHVQGHLYFTLAVLHSESPNAERPPMPSSFLPQPAASLQPPSKLCTSAALSIVISSVPSKSAVLAAPNELNSTSSTAA